MTSVRFHTLVLDQAHDRVGFNSSSEPLNRHLREQATQDVRRRWLRGHDRLAS